MMTSAEPLEKPLITSNTQDSKTDQNIQKSLKNWMPSHWMTQELQ